jgi:oligopeptide transport system permease protein
LLTLILRRLWTAIPTLFVVIFLSFVLMRIAPGGPFDGERPLDPATRAALTKAYGLDLPIHQQFGQYLGRLAHGDFGPSLVYKDFTVTDLVIKGLPISLTLGGLALILALLIGMSSGLAAATKAGAWQDKIIGMGATF